MKLHSAQRVRSDDGVVGINAFRYRIEGDRIEVLDIDDLGSRQTLEALDLAVPPGRNAVLSYLDVLTPNAIDRAQIAAWIQQARVGSELDGAPLTIRFEEQGFIRLNMVHGLALSWQQELEDLAGRLLLLPD